MGLLVAVLLVAWRLASGPVSISFLTPYIESALAETHQGAVKLEVDDTILTWAGWERTLDIRIVNLQTSLPDGQVIATVPEVSVSISAEALLKGVIAPRSVEFFGPSFRIVRQPDGTFALGLEEGGTGGADNFVSSMILLMLQEPEASQAMSYLSRIAIVAGDVTYDDQALGTVWRAPNADAEFIRIEGGLQAELNLGLQAGDKIADVSVMGSYSAAGKRIDLGVSFDALTPADFAGLSEQTEILGVLDLPLAGTMTLSVEQDGRVEGVGFDLSGRSGHLSMPVSMATKLDALAWAQRVEVDELNITGRYEGATDTYDIAGFSLTLADKETIFLPAPIEHAMPLKSIAAQLIYVGNRGTLSIKDMVAGLAPPSGGAGPVARLEADATGLFRGTVEQAQGIGLTLSGVLSDLPFDDLKHYWPAKLGEDAREWVVPNLRDGIAERAAIDLILRPDPDGETELVSVAGVIEAEGLTVDYLNPMPPVTNASGIATFNADRFDIKVLGGEGYGGLKILGGQIALTKLQEFDQFADIELDIQGNVDTALALIDHQPLGFASELGIVPQNTGGDVTTHVELYLPLEAELEARDVDVRADARISGASIKGALFQRDLAEGDLVLVVTNEGLELSGTGTLGKVPIQMKWSSNFREAALFSDRYEISGTIKDVLNLGEMGIEVPDILSRYMQGGAEANVNFTELSDGRQSLSARVDLSNIVLAVPELGWRKPSGVPGTAVLELRLLNDLPVEIPKFSVSAPDMDISGSASFLANGALERIDIDTMRSGYTDVSGSLTPEQDGVWELVLRGERLDATVLWDEMLGISKGAPSEDIQEEETQEEIREEELVLNVAVDLHTLMLRKDRVLHDLIGTVYRDRGLWRKIDVLGVVGEAGSIELLLDTDTDGLRYLSITSDDAGAALRTLDLYDNILRGQFDLKAAYTRPGVDAPLEGVAKITNYAMIDAPAFAKLIGVMSLTGVLDALQGEGLNFDILETPFKLEGGILELIESRSSGPTIGVTASGTIDLDNKVMDLEGTVVPAYAINALLGKLPLIGELFSGPEKGGGLFAATYTMKGTQENVEITVNPLSALAPGALRGIFTGSKKEKDIPDKPPQPKAEPVEPVTSEPVQ